MSKLLYQLTPWYIHKLHNTHRNSIARIKEESMLLYEQYLSIKNTLTHTHITIYLPTENDNNENIIIYTQIRIYCTYNIEFPNSISNAVGLGTVTYLQKNKIRWLFQIIGKVPTFLSTNLPL